MAKNQIINLKYDFNNSANRDCSWDYMNGVVENYNGYLSEEGYEEEAILIDIHVRNSGLRSELIYMHEVFTNFPDILDFVVAVNKMEYCQKHKFNGIVLMKSRTALNWLIGGRLTCAVENYKEIDEVIASLEDAVHWLDGNGCDYGLAIDLESEYGVYNPRSGRGFRVSKLDVGIIRAGHQ